MDIIFCFGKQCPIRDTCYRYTNDLSTFEEKDTITYYTKDPYDRNSKFCKVFIPREVCIESAKKCCAECSAYVLPINALSREVIRPYKLVNMCQEKCK